MNYEYTLDLLFDVNFFTFLEKRLKKEIEKRENFLEKRLQKERSCVTSKRHTSMS